MRLHACTALLLAATGGCAHIPDHIQVDIDGHRIEVVKAPPVKPEELPKTEDER